MDVENESVKKIKNDVNKRILKNGNMIVDEVKKEDEGW